MQKAPKCLRHLTCGFQVSHVHTCTHLTQGPEGDRDYVHIHTVLTEHLTWGFHVDHVLGLSSFFGWGVVVVEYVQHSLRVLLLLHLGDVGTLQQLRPWFWHTLSVKDIPFQCQTYPASVKHILSVINIPWQVKYTLTGLNIPCLCQTYPVSVKHILSVLNIPWQG